MLRVFFNHLDLTIVMIEIHINLWISFIPNTDFQWLHTAEHYARWWNLCKANGVICLYCYDSPIFNNLFVEDFWKLKES